MMKSFIILAISILTAANPLSPRQEAQAPPKARLLLTFRANFCLDPEKPGCDDVFIESQGKPGNFEDFVRDNFPQCIKPESLPCSKIATRCADEFGKEEDADKPFEDVSQDVKDCIIGDLIPALNGIDTDDIDTADQPTETAQPNEPTEKHGDEDEASNEVVPPTDELVNHEQLDACKNAVAAYKKAVTDLNCKAWDVNKCDE